VSLSSREREVLHGLTEGLSNKEIGRNLSLAEITVKLHVRQILKKMGARNRSDAVAKAIRAATPKNES
jgi:DNA-binding NarL/FixJ family response regulator